MFFVAQWADELDFTLEKGWKPISPAGIEVPHEGLRGLEGRTGQRGRLAPFPSLLFQFGVYHRESRGRQVMSNKMLDYAAILADLEAKRGALDNTIAALRNAIVHGTLGEIGEIPASANGIVGTTYSSLSASGGEVPAGAFLGKSIPDATKLYLEIVKKKQTSAEIAEALRKGGMETNSKNFPQMVHSVLDRASKADSGIVKLDRSHWGLVTWYPASLRSAGKYQGRGAGRKKSRKGKPSAKAIVNSSALPPVWKPAGLDVVQAKGKAHERAMEYLRIKPLGEHSLADVGGHLGMGIKGARLILGKLVKAGKVRMSAPGMYTVVPFQLTAVS